MLRFVFIRVRVCVYPHVVNSVKHTAHTNVFAPFPVKTFALECNLECTWHDFRVNRAWV